MMSLFSVAVMGSLAVVINGVGLHLRSVACAIWHRFDRTIATYADRYRLIVHSQI